VVDVTSSTKERGRCDIEHVGLPAGVPSAREISMMMGQKAHHGVPFGPSSSDFAAGRS